METTRRCIVLFSREPRQEGAAKGMRSVRPLFEMASRRIAAAARALEGVDLLVPRQRGGTFGERLIDAFQQARALGYGQVVAVPIDTPGLGGRHLREAFDRLETREVVLGPAPDGGVYLIGLNEKVDPGRLLRRVRWMTSRVLDDLLAAAPDALLLGDRLADLDAPEDLRRILTGQDLDPDVVAIIRDLLSPPRTTAPDRDPRAPRTSFFPAFLLRGPPAPCLA